MLWIQALWRRKPGFCADAVIFLTRGPSAPLAFVLWLSWVDSYFQLYEMLTVLDIFQYNTLSHTFIYMGFYFVLSNREPIIPQALYSTDKTHS
jgi:hypothetical protein